jgi:hypothetical protein
MLVGMMRKMWLRMPKREAHSREYELPPWNNAISVVAQANILGTSTPESDLFVQWTVIGGHLAIDG